jgi:hypothetical protein
MIWLTAVWSLVRLLVRLTVSCSLILIWVLHTPLLMLQQLLSVDLRLSCSLILVRLVHALLLMLQQLLPVCNLLSELLLEPQLLLAFRLDLQLELSLLSLEMISCQLLDFFVRGLRIQDLKTDFDVPKMCGIVLEWWQ